MNPEVKTLWLDALRSGEYAQCTGQLSNGDRYCCLGVLTDLAAEAGVVQWETDVRDIDGDLHEVVVEWAGLDDGNPETNEGFRLIALNDTECYTFAEIADVIERDL